MSHVGPALPNRDRKEACRQDGFLTLPQVPINLPLRGKNLIECQARIPASGHIRQITLSTRDGSRFGQQLHDHPIEALLSPRRFLTKGAFHVWRNEGAAHYFGAQAANKATKQKTFFAAGKQCNST